MCPCARHSCVHECVRYIKLLQFIDLKHRVKNLIRRSLLLLYTSRYEQETIARDYLLVSKATNKVFCSLLYLNF